MVAEFEATHTINGVPVMRQAPEKGWPFYLKEDGTKAHIGKGHKAIPMGAAPVEPTVAPAKAPLSVSPAIVAQVEETKAFAGSKPVMRTVSPEQAAIAIYARYSPNPFAMNTNDDHAYREADGTVILECYQPKDRSHYRMRVRVPETFEFEVVEVL